MAMLGNAASWVDAFPKLDLIVHMYMYPTSFSTEAADLLLPTAEWLETERGTAHDEGRTPRPFPNLTPNPTRPVAP